MEDEYPEFTELDDAELERLWQEILKERVTIANVSRGIRNILSQRPLEGLLPDDQFEDKMRWAISAKVADAFKKEAPQADNKATPLIEVLDSAAVFARSQPAQKAELTPLQKKMLDPNANYGYDLIYGLIDQAIAEYMRTKKPDYADDTYNLHPSRLKERLLGYGMAKYGLNI